MRTVFHHPSSDFADTLTIGQYLTLLSTLAGLVGFAVLIAVPLLKFCGVF